MALTLKEKALLRRYIIRDIPIIFKNKIASEMERTSALTDEAVRSLLYQYQTSELPRLDARIAELSAEKNAIINNVEA